MKKKGASIKDTNKKDTNKKDTSKKGAVKYIAALAAVLLLAGVVCGVLGWRVHKNNVLLRQQNYVASCLMERGEYEQGRLLAAWSEQQKKNDVSEELLVLAAGFQADYEVGILYAEKYLQEREDGIIESAEKIYRRTLKEIEELPKENRYAYAQAGRELMERDKQEILTLLFQVQNGIDVKKTDERLTAVTSLFAGDSGASEAAALLESDKSVLAQKARSVYDVRMGNYGEALESAERLYEEDKTVENRARLANLAAEELSVLKAIQFVEGTTPLTQKDTAAYRLELAQLNYLAGREEKARELLAAAVKEDGKASDPAALFLSDFLRTYERDGEAQAGASYADRAGVVDRETLWSRISGLLGFIDKGYFRDEESFYEFVENTMDEIYNGIILRNIDATAFPTVRVTVNVSVDLEERLKKKDFIVTEMGARVKEFTLLNPENIEEIRELSVVLVVDRSGSMQGTPMEDTKKAVISFAKSVDENVEAGLIAFDSDAYVAAPIAQNKSGVIRGTAALSANGGTNICAGLRLAGQELEGRSGRKVVILLSDGQDGNTVLIDEILEELRLSNIYVYTIGFAGADMNYLSYIAERCGGKFIQADTSGMLKEIYASVGGYMANDYVIEFEAVTEPEKFARTLKIQLNRNDAFDEKEYHVGVTFEEIEKEKDKRPLADYFRQVGGSWMEAE